MSDGEEEFFVPAVAASSGPAEEEECFVPKPEPVAKTRNVGRVGRPRAPPTSAAFGSWVCVQSPSGSSSSSTEAFSLTGVSSKVVGLGELLWEYKPSASDTGAAVAGGPGGKGARSAVTVGHIEYSLVHFYYIDPPWEVPLGFDLSSHVCPLHLSLNLQDHTVQEFGKTVKEFEAASSIVLNRTVVLSADVLASAMASPFPSFLWRVPVRATRMDLSTVVRDCPPESYVKWWRRDSGIARRIPAAEAPHAEPVARAALGPLLALPAKRPRPRDGDGAAPIEGRVFVKQRKRDPMLMVTACSFFETPSSGRVLGRT